VNKLEPTETRRRQHRRLRELQIAIGIAGATTIAWHVRQALRSGASGAEVREAMQSGLAVAGQAAIVVRTAAFTRLLSGAPSRPLEAGEANRNTRGGGGCAQFTAAFVGNRLSGIELPSPR
jgi:hypothetical protein